MIKMVRPNPAETGVETPTFQDELQELNKARAQFIYHRTQENPEAIEEYLNHFPQPLAPLASNELFIDALSLFIDRDPILGVKTLVTKMKNAKSNPKIIDLMEQCLEEDVHNENFHIYALEQNSNDILQMYTARIRTAYLLYGRELNGAFANRFLLALLKACIIEGAEVPQKYLILLDENELEEFFDFQNSHEREQSRYRTQRQIKKGVLPPTAMMIPLKERAKILDILETTNDTSATEPPSAPPQNPSYAHLQQLIQLYPDPRVLMSILLEESD